MASFTRRNTRAAKVNMEMVKEIRARYAAGATQGELSREFKIGAAQIGRIVRGECWQQVEATPALSAEEDIAAMARRTAAVQAERSGPPPMEDLDPGEPPALAETLERFNRSVAGTAQGMLKEIEALEAIKTDIPVSNAAQERIARLKGEVK